MSKAQKISDNVKVEFELPRQLLERMESGVEMGIATKLDELLRMACRDILIKENITLWKEVKEEQKQQFGG